MKGAGTPIDNKEHPRVWLSSSTLPEIRTRLAGPLKNDFQQFVNFLDSEYGTIASASDFHLGVRNYCFLYAVGPVTGINYGRSRADYGTKGAELTRKLAASGGLSGYTQQMVSGYDWCYQALTASDKATVVARLKDVVQKPYGPGNARNPFHHVEIKDRANYILAGLAFANDGIDDLEAARRITAYSELWTGDGGILPAENFIAGGDGGVSSGTAYSVAGTGGDSQIVTSMLLSEGWRTAMGLTRDAVFAANNGFRYFPQWMAYSVLPFRRADGVQVLYSTHQTDRGTQAVGFVDLSLTLASLRLYRDIDPQMAGLAEWLNQNQTGRVPQSGVVGRRSAALGNFIFNPGNVTPQSPSALNLPLTKLFRGLGWLVMRTGWEDTGDSVITFTAAPYTRKPSYANHDHGGFTVDRNGPLVINAGAGIHHAFQENTRAHNTLMFTNPAEPVNSWPEYWDMGGQRLLFGIPAGISELVKGSQWDIGGIKRSDLDNNTAAHDYDYAYADVTRAYNGPLNSDSYNTKKVQLFSRQFVYFRRPSGSGSDRIIVFDRTETVSTQFEKRWQLHPAGRGAGGRSFVISGHSGVAAGPVRNGTSTGRQTFTQPDTITITNTENGSNGRLFWKPLLPASRILVEVGGTGHEFEDAYGKQISEASSFSPENAQYVGNYTLELQPAIKTNLSEIFLNVLEATTPSQNAATATNLINGTSTVGAAVGDRMAIFKRTEGYVSSDTFSVPRSAQYRILLCDLQPGMNYNVNGQVVTAGSGGTAYVTLNLSAGATVSLAATGAVTALAPAAPTGVRVIRQ
jgi:hypothetical protein